MSVWKTLSTIDCNEHVDKKGQFSYLSWTWAWCMVKENYPLAFYRLLDDTVYPDGTMEVRVEVTIEELAHTMWLPVLDFKNKAIQYPNAFDINSSRMRCLVKCLAMFGLGHYIYAGESVPQEAIQDPYTPEQLAQFKKLIVTENGWGILELSRESGPDVMAALFNAAFPKGEVSKGKQKFRDLAGAANAELKVTLAYIREALVNGELSTIEEALSERNDLQRKLIWDGLTEIEKMQVDSLRKVAV